MAQFASVITLAWLIQRRLYACTPYGARRISLVLAHRALVASWLPSVWRERGKLGPAASGVGHMKLYSGARVTTSSLAHLASVAQLHYGCGPHGASTAALGLGHTASVVLWLYLVWLERSYLGLVSATIGHITIVPCMAPA